MEFDSHWGGQNQKKGTATYTPVTAANMEFDSHWGGQNQKKGTATYTQPRLTMFLVIAALALVGVRNRWRKTLAIDLSPVRTAAGTGFRRLGRCWVSRAL